MFIDQLLHDTGKRKLEPVRAMFILWNLNYVKRSRGRPIRMFIDKFIENNVLNNRSCISLRIVSLYRVSDLILIFP